MKKALFVLLATLVLLLESCKGLNTRTVILEIPLHPWEEASGKMLWHDLKIYGRNFKKDIYLGPSQKEARLKVPLGESLCFLAFPLGFCLPFGGWVSPQTQGSRIVLNQNNGLILGELVKAEGCISDLNYEALLALIQEKTSDFRKVDRGLLLKEAANGKLSFSSVCLKEPALITDLDLSPGLWHCELGIGGRLYKSISQEPSFGAYPGTIRYYNFQNNLMLTVFVKEDLSYEASIKEGLIP